MGVTMGSISRELEFIRAALRRGKSELQTVSTLEAAKALRVSTRRLAALMRAGLLASTVMDGERRVPLSELKKLRR